MAAPGTGKRSGSAAARRDLQSLLSRVRQYGGGAAAAKLELLERLEHATLPAAGDVSELHEAACFLRAYPDSAELLSRVERILGGFAARPDLQRHRAALASTGIAGTDMHFAYYWFTTCLLARRWPELLTIEWEKFDHAGELEELLPLMLSEHEALALEETGPGSAERSLAEQIALLKGRSETDAAFLVDAFRKLRADPLLREKLFDDLVMPLILAPGRNTPCRTLAAFPLDETVFQNEPLARAQAPTKRAFREEPRSAQRVSRADGQRLVWLARESMMTRKRDLYAFIHADPDDVVLVDYGEGLHFACIGITPDRRSLLHAMYVILAMKNGVPVGYVQASTLFESAEVNFNIFDTFRAAEASRVFVASLAMIHHAFAAETFAINTQQLGQDNPEAIATGAWWFYHKHGFRPDGPELLALSEHELAARRRDPSRRSSPATLRKLSTEPIFLSLGPRRSDAVGRLDIPHLSANIGKRVSRQLDCRRGQLERRCSSAARTRLGVADTGRWSPAERRAWTRWAPLVVALPGVESWSAAERRALVRIVRAKASHHEVDFVRLFDAHAPLRRALRRLAR